MTHPVGPAAAQGALRRWARVYLAFFVATVVVAVVAIAGFGNLSPIGWTIAAVGLIVDLNFVRLFWRLVAVDDRRLSARRAGLGAIGTVLVTIGSRGAAVLAGPAFVLLRWAG